MQFSKLLSFTIVALLVAVVFAGLVSIPAAAQTDAMQFRYNAQHTGDYSSVAGPVPSNGQLKWSHPTGTTIYSSPAIANGVVYIGRSHYVDALDALTGQLKWSFQTGHWSHSSPAVVNGVVYIGSQDKNIYAVDAATGALKWSYPTGDWIDSSPAVANGVVYIGSGDGKLYAIDAATGAFKWSYTTEPQTPFDRSSPAVANGIVYIGDWSGNLLAIDAATGAFKWSYNIGNTAVESSPAVVNNVVYVGGSNGVGGNGQVYALDAATGAFKWSYETGYNYVWSSPAVANGVVYVGAHDGNVYALEAATGAFKWSYPTGGPIYDSPAFANGVIYVGGSSSYNLYAFDANTGAKVWNYMTNGYVMSSPAVANGVVYVGSNDGNIYAIGNQPTPPANQAPTADAGADQTVHAGIQVTLDGTSSTDPDNNLPLTYEWSINLAPTGSTAKLSSTTADKPTFIPDKLGDYTVQLVVQDSLGLQSTTNAVKITANNQASIASAGADQTAIVRGTVKLEGSASSDPDGDQLTYAWTIVSKPQSSTATLSNPTSAQPTLKPDRMGTYVLQLVVNDGYVNSAPDTVTVTVTPTKATVTQDLATLRTTVNNLPASAFKPGTKIALLASLKAAELQINSNRYAPAATTLQKVVLPRMDGCAKNSAPDSNDWVRTCPAQAQLYPQVLNLIQELKALQGS